MPAQTVRLRGYRETMRALQKVDKDTAKVVRDELINAGEGVASDARGRISRYSGARAHQIGPRATNRGVFVTQRAKKVSGKRGDFGALQMAHLLEALADNEDEVIEGVEDAFDRLIRHHGF